MIKINLGEFKNFSGQISFFWQVLIIVFFVCLIAILILSAVFWLKLESDLTKTLSTEKTSASETLKAQSLNNILTQIKNRSANLATPPIDGPVLADPSR